MPKQKTHKGLMKRVKVTARGKIRAHKSYSGHLMSGKNAKRRRRLGKVFIIRGAVVSRIKELLGSNR
jgi:large subunit ribosomal protein L35